MTKKIAVVGFLAVSLLAAGGLSIRSADAKPKKEQAPAPVLKAKPLKLVKAEQCFECHDKEIKQFHSSGKHAKVNCAYCHDGLDKHLDNPGPETRPATDVSWETCGQCHQDQYNTFLKETYHRPARDEKSQLTGRSPNPYWDKLMMGHGFTKEHNTTRGHDKMLIDQFAVDRAFGGRFQGKNGWQYVLEQGKVFDVLEDKYPNDTEHKPRIPQSAAAANPVCLQCKTQDNILKWGYLGDPATLKKGATFARTSNVVDVARSVKQGFNCIYCHDPHSAKPRIVRDGLIQALTRPEGDTLWHKDPNRTMFTVYTMGLRGFDRKIAILDKYDTKLQCGQCHVEYNCNDGYDPKNPDTSKKTIGYDSPLTNHFPYKDVLGLYDHYVNQVGFLDFKHPLTGGLLWKAQHPEAETYYNSTHGKKGVGCDACHLPKVKDAKGKVFTSHFAVTPKVQLKETCLKCHPKWSEEQAKYAIDSVRAHFKGKMRKAEFWLSALIDKIVEAKKAGVDADTIKKAQDYHLKAHILWEYWTAENSDGFHNPALARESLTKSVDDSQAGIKLLTDAMAGKTASAAPAK
jgi:formate-dependent nitrite reductase cytochrome c552 subunit